MLNEAGEKKRGLNDWIFGQTNGVVLSGPFTGMKVLPEESWVDGNLSCKLLGTYEQELHGSIEAEIARLNGTSNPVIVNVGCAEGYYAIGMKRRAPLAIVYCIDIDDEALKIALRAAEINEAAIIVGADLEEVFAQPDFVICDCEGGEIKYLDKEKFPSLANASILVECHEMQDHPPVTQTLADRFKDTHTINLYIEGGRDPNQFEFLRQCHSLDRWAAVSEGRPCMMHWLHMVPNIRRET